MLAIMINLKSWPRAVREPGLIEKLSGYNNGGMLILSRRNYVWCRFCEVLGILLDSRDFPEERQFRRPAYRS